MKSAEQIEERVRFLLKEELQKRLQEAQMPLPHRCRHHYDHPLDYRKTVEGGPNSNYNRIQERGGALLPVVNTIGLCLFGSDQHADWEGTICEDPLDAQECPHSAFTPIKSPKEVYEQFLKDLQDESWVVVNLPRIQPLLWVLGSRYEQLDEEPPQPPKPSLPGLLQRLYQAVFPPPPKEAPKLPEGPSATLQVYLPPPP